MPQLVITSGNDAQGNAVTNLLEGLSATGSTKDLAISGHPTSGHSSDQIETYLGKLNQGAAYSTDKIDLGYQLAIGAHTSNTDITGFNTNLFFTKTDFIS